MITLLEESNEEIEPPSLFNRYAKIKWRVVITNVTYIYKANFYNLSVCLCPNFPNVHPSVCFQIIQMTIRLSVCLNQKVRLCPKYLSTEMRSRRRALLTTSFTFFNILQPTKLTHYFFYLFCFSNFSKIF